MALKVFLLVLMLTISWGDSLKCYECTTHVDPSSPCVDLSKGKDTVTTAECAHDEVCAVFKSKNPATGSNTITRTCSPKNICDTLHSKETNYNKIEDCDTCDTDLCSSGILNGISVATLVIGLILVTFGSQLLL